MPKGTKRDDYEPEVLRDFDREAQRSYSALHRTKRRRMGVREVNFQLGQEARDKLERLCRMHGQSKTQVLTRLITEAPDVEENS